MDEPDKGFLLLHRLLLIYLHCIRGLFEDVVMLAHSRNPTHEYTETRDGANSTYASILTLVYAIHLLLDSYSSTTSRESSTTESVTPSRPTSSPTTASKF